jgi:uncharacterized protein (DUF697 family)
VDRLRERLDAEADSCIRWGAGRAAAIAMSSIPLADAVPLVGNQVYMAHKIGDVYGVSFTDSTINGLLAAMGASLCGLLLISFVSGLKVPIAASITFAAGKAIKLWCQSGGALSAQELKAEYERARREATGQRWHTEATPDNGTNP